MSTKIFIIFLLIYSPYLFGQIDHWETAVLAEDYWQYQEGNSSIPDGWNTLDFVDDFWLFGMGSIGYGDGDDNTFIEPTTSLYMRRTFQVVDKSAIERAIFHADYDDGFVAYLNGIEIARANLEGTPPTHETWATELREALMYEGGNPIPFSIGTTQLNEILQEGENVLTVQTHNYEGAASTDMTTLYWLSFGINNDTYDYNPVPDWFISPEFTTNLPILKVNTFDTYISEEATVGELGIIWNGEGQENNSQEEANEFFGNMTIKRRGQSSLGLFPKNGYAIETKDEIGEDKDVAFLNFPEEEDWILHGPYSDKTLLRNVITMHWAKGMGQYASRTRFVELLINEQYEGIYVLMEKIKRDKNRVDIATLNPEDIEGDELTGGYVFKIDKGDADWFSQYDMINSPYSKLAFQYVSPKLAKIQPEQEAYLQAYVDSFETAIKYPNNTIDGKTYADFIDINSFAEHFILTELTKNVDGYRISTYMYKEKDSKGGKIHAGPMWDFNIALGNIEACNGLTEWGWMYEEHCGNSNPFWWGNFLEEEAFVNAVKCRWLESRETVLHMDSITEFINEKVALLSDGAVDRNFERWQVLDQYVWPNPFIHYTYTDEITYLKNYLTARITWMDNNIFGICTLPPIDTVDTNIPTISNIEIQLFPNPSKDILRIESELLYGEYEVGIFTTEGQECYTEKTQISQNHTIDISDLTTGNYLLKIYDRKNDAIQWKKFMVF